MTTPFDAPDWRAMSQQDRDLGLNNGVAVRRKRRDRRRLGAAFRRDARALSRSSRPPLRPARAQPDRLPQGRRGTAPTLLFIHGGYWQTRAKEVFAVFAEGPMAHGINVALIGYTLAPDATLDQIVAEIHAGIDFLAGQLPALGGDGNGIVVSGWSAGGHLTSMALSHPQVRGGHGDIRHLRSRADPRQLSQRQARARRGDVAAQLADDAGRRRAKAAVAGRRAAPNCRCCASRPRISPAIAPNTACR